MHKVVAAGTDEALAARGNVNFGSIARRHLLMPTPVAAGVIPHSSRKLTSSSGMAQQESSILSSLIGNLSGLEFGIHFENEIYCCLVLLGRHLLPLHWKKKAQ